MVLAQGYMNRARAKEQNPAVIVTDIFIPDQVVVFRIYKESYKAIEKIVN